MQANSGKPMEEGIAPPAWARAVDLFSPSDRKKGTLRNAGVTADTWDREAVGIRVRRQPRLRVMVSASRP
ncbi:hypothetical protein H8B02_18750 [Bradyrhizobium sp. Pear77]|uniref:hypothetical protein n=1 Tax=Bradyrhizobium altum TaxID=1571202 RepID=UPI001E3DC32A|nr:hypothetical protein [Bradyrhizobium altum]MCC8955396.1 hypothetical protein [Bradyrhizobium altum]